jgi:F-type H+-transporting ATPase subunit b
MTNILLTQFAAEEAEASGIAALGFDPKAFLIQLVTFLLIFYILKRFAFGRIVDLLEKRRKTIEDGVTMSAKMAQEKEKLDREISKIRAETRKDAEQLLDDTKAQATTILKEAETNAAERANQIIEEARAKIDDETARARRKLEKELVGLVVEATEAVTREKLDAKKDGALITEALKGRA